MHQRTKPTTHARAFRAQVLFSLAGLTVLTLMPCAARAAVIDARWTVVGNGNWATPGNWTPLGVPNNTASNTYRVTIDNGFEARIQNISPTIDSLTIGSTSGLLLFHENLTVLDGFRLDGLFNAFDNCTVQVGASGAATALVGTGTIAILSSNFQLLPTGPLTVGDGIHVMTGNSVAAIGTASHTLDTGASISGGGATSLLGSQITNTGTISVSQLSVSAASSFTNAGHLLGVGTSTTSIVAGNMFSNAGTITANSTSTLTINAPVIVNTGRITAPGTLVFGQAPTTLTNSGTVELSRNTTVAALTNANGTITLNNNRLSVPGPMLGRDVGTINGIGTFSVSNLDNTGNALHALVNMNIGGTFRGGTLTTAAGRTVYVGGNGATLDGVTINGNLDYSWPSPWQIIDGKLDGNGTVNVSFGTLSTPAAQLSIGTALTVRSNGSTIGDRNKPLDNFGKIAGGVIAGNPIRNHGEIGSAVFDGKYTLADLGNLTGTSYKILGTLLNDGATLSVSASTPVWSLGGTIQGGTIETRDGRTIHVPYVFAGPSQYTNAPRLDNVVMNAHLVVDNNSLTIGNGELIGNGTVTLYPLAGTFVGRVVSATQTLTIGSDITIRSGGAVTNALGLGGSVGSPGSFTQRAIVNHGTLRADPPALFGRFEQELDLFGVRIFNDGALVIGTDGMILAAEDIQFGFPSPTTLTFGVGGVLDVDLSATAGWGLLQVAGTLDLSTAGDQLILSRSPGTSDGTFYLVVTTSAGITGHFDSVTPGYEVEYRNSNSEIWARFIPEPASCAFIGVAASLLARRTSRSRRNRLFS